jgi:hypothetical protein
MDREQSFIRSKTSLLRFDLAAEQLRLLTAENEMARTLRARVKALEDILPPKDASVSSGSSSS